MPLDDKDLLQSNSIILVGILILAGIGAAEGAVQVISVALMSAILFAISSLILLFETPARSSESRSYRFRQLAYALSAVGFISILIGMFVLMMEFSDL